MNRREFLKTITVACAAGAPVLNFGAADPASGLKLPQRTLGKTGVSVTALALGGVIGMQLPPSTDLDPAAIAEAALDLGITYFDTSPDYNNGQSETNYGKVMARRRKEVFLASKTNDRTADGTMRSIEASLKRLQTDHLDLLQIHGASETEDLSAWGKPGGVLSALQKLKDQKTIRFFGVTGHASAAPLRRAIEMYKFDTLLTTLNPVARRQPFREELLPVANQKGLGVIAMKVMGGGNGCLAKGNPVQQVLRPYHDQTARQATPPQLLRYTLSLPISVAVVGVASIELVPTPGHTLSLCSLLFDGDGLTVAVVGDAVATRDFWLERRGYFNCVDFELSAKSMERLAKMADVIVPGHDNYFLNRRTTA